jgi:hypothetical protein
VCVHVCMYGCVCVCVGVGCWMLGRERRGDALFCAADRACACVHVCMYVYVQVWNVECVGHREQV